MHDILAGRRIEAQRDTPRGIGEQPELIALADIVATVNAALHTQRRIADDAVGLECGPNRVDALFVTGEVDALVHDIGLVVGRNQAHLAVEKIEAHGVVFALRHDVADTAFANVEAPLRAEILRVVAGQHEPLVIAGIDRTGAAARSVEDRQSPEQTIVRAFGARRENRVLRPVLTVAVNHCRSFGGNALPAGGVGKGVDRGDVQRTVSIAASVEIHHLFAARTPRRRAVASTRCAEQCA